MGRTKDIYTHIYICNLAAKGVVEGALVEGIGEPDQRAHYIHSCEEEPRVDVALLDHVRVPNLCECIVIYLCIYPYLFIYLYLSIYLFIVIYSFIHRYLLFIDVY